LINRGAKIDRQTSPFASKVFILSRNPESITLDSSRIKQIFSSLHPEKNRFSNNQEEKFFSLLVISKHKFQNKKFYILTRILMTEDEKGGLKYEEKS